ncbi:MAG: tRNA (adenosine(37)-N6)-threonylcarbamoyltransferase complex ATPase subunit type 1 TsaE [Ktedonobacterales bacterium]
MGKTTPTMTEPPAPAPFEDVTATPRAEVRSASLEETQRLGMLLGALARAGDVILLDGDLGAGKTAFTQGIGLGLGVAATINSPTFTILKEYQGRLPLYHFDLYRIDDPDEIASLGFDEYFDGDGVCVVEWAERGEVQGASSASYWPERWLRVRFVRILPDERVLELSAVGERGQGLLADFVAAAHDAQDVRAGDDPGTTATADGVA